jgi:hypothetical protein
MKTREQVIDFFNKNKINPGWEPNHYEIEISSHDDGDVYQIAKIPLWGQNHFVVYGVIKLLSNILIWENKDTYISAIEGFIQVCIYESACNPD